MTNDNEIHDAETSEETTGSKTRAWVEENLRLIVSVIIVLAIAGGIYSYSQRGQENRIALEDDTTQEQILLEGEDAMDEDDNSMGQEFTDEDEDASLDEGVSSTETTEEVTSEGNEQARQEASSTQPEQESTPTQETTESYIVTANSGDGLTHLARRATADYLAQNPNNSLTVAHKIYIEDYLRKAVHHHDGVSVGTQVTFSKDLIRQAISASEMLTSAQIDNLQKYVALAPSLS